MDLESLAQAGRTIFEASTDTITVEYQGGDPLLRFDLVRRSIQQISELNREKRRRMRFVVASTLHQLTPKMCEFFKEHKVYLSTSLDGPKELHNKNRPSPTRDSYERTIAGIELARAELGQDSVSALMTTTRASLTCPEAIVDEYVRLGFQDIFIRPLSYYGFAKRNQLFLAYSQEQFQRFYEKALEHVLDWNAKGVAIREVYASIILNKILGTFDAGYVDLQPPSDTGRGVLVFNYDGNVYPSDEARMLAETGDSSFRMGCIGDSIESLLSSEAHQGMCRAVSDEYLTGCADCAYRTFCGPNAVDAFAQSGSMSAPVHTTQHCARQLWMFDMLYCKLRTAPDWMQDLFSRWGQHNEVSA
jgi:His-Xaa-Ser system radical SAM maturase HxsB